MLRDHADEDALRVLVVDVVEAGPVRAGPLGGRRRARRVDPEPEPVAVPVTRATVIRGRPVDLEAARAWVAAPRERVAPELAVLNRVLHLHRVAAADPAVRPVREAGATAVRVGFGAGEEVAHGRWTEAVAPPPERGPGRRAGREAALRPQERLAALLGGRDAALAAESAALDARASLDAGLVREAALGLRVALEAALAELEAWRDRGDLATRLAELREERGVVSAAANEALRGGLPEATAAEVARVLGRVEAALRARTAHLD